MQTPKSAAPNGTPNQGGMTAAGEQATPQEQEAYERVVAAGLKVLYDDATHDSVMNMLKNGEPTEVLANTVATVMLQLDKQSGGKIPEVVILPAAAEILAEAANLATTAKLFQADERTIAVATQRLVITLCEQYGVEASDVQALMQSIPKEQIQQMVAEQSKYSVGSNAAPQAPQAPQAGV